MTEESLFAAAIELPPGAERAAFLEHACGDDAALRDRVLHLLRAHDRAMGPLEMPIPVAEHDDLPDGAESRSTLTAAENAVQALGSVIAGRYKLLEQIGEGGMGTVWVAEQTQPVRRKVALKLIKAGMDSKTVLSRFEAERQALAVMDHPNIAKVLDGGSTNSGRPFFVMEYVKGISLTKYCDDVRLNIAERLALFVSVCQAVQHAHQKGIIHRDLKPSNILVCLYDGKPVPKVIDFGLAKAMHQPLTEQTLYTAHGIMIGTPLYMSPEQAEINNLDVDTRTDVYSLGVILYELLTGTTPLEKREFQAAAWHEMLRLIKEVEPPCPSARLSGSGTLPSLAAQRHLEPMKLTRVVRGELDWIVMKCLEKDRSRRYDTATGLARDVERYLADDLVEARPPSRAYRLQKLVRKNRGMIISMACVMVALLIGVFGTGLGLIRARIAENAAIESEKKKDAALGLVTIERDAKERQRELAESATDAESEQRVKSERHLVSGILRPIGFNNHYDPAELRSLIDWSALGDSRLQLLALEVGFEDPATAFREARRAALVIQACVGLSTNRRKLATDFVLSQQRNAQSDPRIRIAACWLALELGSVEITALEESLTYLADPAHKCYSEFDQFLQAVILYGNSRQLIVPIVLKAMSKLPAEPAGPRFLFAKVHALVALTPQLSPQQVATEFDELIASVRQLPNRYDGLAAEDALAGLASRLAADDIAQRWDAALDVINEISVPETQQGMSDVLRVLTLRLSKQHAADRIDAKIEDFEKSTDAARLRVDAEILNVLVSRMTPEQVNRAFDAIITIWTNHPSNDDRSWIAAASITTLVPRLTSEQIAVAWDGLVARSDTIGERIVKLEDRFFEPEQPLAAPLIAMVPRLGPDKATRTFDTLVEDVLQKSVDLNVPWIVKTINSTGPIAVALAAQLPLGEVTHGFDALAEVLENSKSAEAIDFAGQGLVSLAPRLPNEIAMQRGDTLISILEKSTDWLPRQRATANALVALGPRLTAKQVSRNWDLLVAFLQKPLEDENGAISNALVALAPRLGAEQITIKAKTLIANLASLTDWNASQVTGKSFAALAPRLPPEQVTRVAETIVTALKKSTELNTQGETPVSLDASAEMLVALMPRMTQKQRVTSAEALFESLVPSRTSFQLAAGLLLLEDPDRDRISNKLMQILMDLMMTSPGELRAEQNGYAVFRAAAAAMSNPRSLATLLSHPSCFGKLREILLERFEELVFHDGRSVYLNMKSPGESATANYPLSAPPRVFQNLYNASDWIHHNWPDFDLETNHPVNWRSHQ